MTQVRRRRSRASARARACVRACVCVCVYVCVCVWTCVCGREVAYTCHNDFITTSISAFKWAAIDRSNPFSPFREYGRQTHKTVSMNQISICNLGRSACLPGTMNYHWGEPVYVKTPMSSRRCGETKCMDFFKDFRFFLFKDLLKLQKIKETFAFVRTKGCICANHWSEVER